MQMSSLFVGNLSSHVRRREFENAFLRFGRCSLEVKEGYGFVVFEDYHDAKQALETLQGRSICGEQPSLSWARKRRPFQRFFRKENFSGRERYSSKGKQPLLEDKRSSEVKRGGNLEDVKEGLRTSEVRDEPAISIERDADLKCMGLEKSSFDHVMKDADNLDGGRWDPNMEGSPDSTLVEKLLENEQHFLDDEDKEHDRGSIHDKPQGSSRERHHDRSSRTYRYPMDQYKRGQETFGGRQQERCYNCGKSGHTKWHCWSRSTRINVQSREGLYDARRNGFRYPGNGGGFRGIDSNGGFRGSNSFRRMLTRDIETSYGRKSLRKLDVNIDRKRSDQVETKSCERTRHRHRSQRSGSPRDSSSRNKKKHRSSKKSTHSTKKRKRSSLGSPSSSPSQRSISSSPSRSQSHSGSKSESSMSGSQSSDPGSRSWSSNSQYSRSHSLSANSSRSMLLSAQSGKSDSQSRSKSPLSNSHLSDGISSPFLKRSSLHTSSSARGSQSCKYADDKQVGTSYRCEYQSKEAYKVPSSDNEEQKGSLHHFSESQDANQHDAKRIARRQVWSLEFRKQQVHTRSDVEEHPLKADPHSNGVVSVVRSVETDSVEEPAQLFNLMNDVRAENGEDLKGSVDIFEDWTPDPEGNSSATMIQQDGRVVGGTQSQGTFRFGAARLWPLEAMLYMRFKRGPVSSENYERRKAQNEEFGIKDTFVRSSSGWWESRWE